MKPGSNEVPAGSEPLSRYLSHRWAGLALVASQAFIMAFAWRLFALPIICVAAATLGVLFNLRFARSREQWLVLWITLAVLCGLQQLVAPFDVDRESLVFRASVAFPSTEFLLLVQALAFFRRDPQDRLPVWLPGAGAVFLTIVTDVMPHGPTPRTVLLAGVVSFIVSAAWFLDSRSRVGQFRDRAFHSRPGATIAAVAILATIAWISGSQLYGLGRRLDALLAGSLFRRTIAVDLGFSSVSRLGTVARCKSFRSEELALRIAATEYPGYLRGKAFDEYHNGDWMAVAGGRSARPAETIPPGMSPPLPGERIFQIPGRGEPARCVNIMWSQKDLGEFLFAPLGACAFKATAQNVTVNRHDIAETVNNLLETPYDVAVANRPAISGPTPELRKRLLAVPKELDSRIGDLARRLFADCATPQQRIAAVETHFRDNFHYSLDVQIPFGKEPLAHFLFENHVGDCEYFASAATILLRLGGLPCRYVTGFVPTEHNEYSGTWVARNKDAHAWVECYSDTKGWITIDATPESGIPDRDRARGRASRMWEAATGWLQNIVFRTRRQGVISLLKTAAGNRLFAPCLAIVGAWTAIRMARRRRSRRPPTLVSPRLGRLQHILSLLDRQAARLQLLRGANETIERFARRLEQAFDGEPCARSLACAYRQYSQIRYGGESTEDDLAQLRKAIANCRATRSFRRLPGFRRGPGPSESPGCRIPG